MASRLQDVLQVGIRADQPLATDVATGTLYSVSDESFLIEQSDGAAWVSWGPTPTGGTLTNIRVSAGTTSNLLSALTFSNGSNVSFGLAASVITASVNTSLTNIRLSAGTTSGLLSAFTLADSNGLSFGLSNGVVTGSFSTGGLTNINVSAGTTSNNLSAMTFSNGSNVSFGINASVITASINTSLTNIKVSAGASSANLSALTFDNSNNVTFGLNGSVITASVAPPSAANINVSAGTTSLDLAAITFANSNGITFGLSGNSVLTASHNGLTSQTSPVASLFAVSNTTQATSGTQNISALSFVGAGGVSVGVSNGSVVISGSTGGAGGGVTLSNWNNFNGFTTVANNQRNTQASVIALPLWENVAFSNIRFDFSLNPATVPNLSSQYLDLSVSGVFYSRNGSTLSSITSFSNTMFQTFNSNNTGSLAGVNMLTASLPATTFSAGSYWLMLHISTNNTATGATGSTTTAGFSMQPIIIRAADTSFYTPRFWNQTIAGSNGLVPGQGIVSTSVTMVSIAFSDYSMTASLGLQAVAIELRNQTFQ